MRRSAGLPALRDGIAARDPDRAGILLHAVGQAQSHRHQRAQRPRAEDISRIQGRAWSWLRLLLDRKEEAGPADDQDQKRRQGLSDRTSMDDQPLKRDPSNPNQNKRRSNAPR